MYIYIYKNTQKNIQTKTNIYPHIIDKQTHTYIYIYINICVYMHTETQIYIVVDQ